MAKLFPINSQAISDEPIEILRRRALQQQLLSIQICQKQPGMVRDTG